MLMNIAFLSTFYPFRGGIAQFNANLFRALEKSADIRAYNFSVQYPDFLFPGQTQFVTGADNADPIPSRRLLNSVSPLSWFKTAAAIRRSKPDFLLTAFWMPFFAPSMGTVAARVRTAGIPVISLLNNVIPHEKRPGDLALMRYFLKHNDGFITMSNAVTADLQRLRPEARVLMRPHPVYSHFGAKTDRTAARQRLGLAPDKNILLFFGFIRTYKGLDLLIRSMALLPGEFELVIAGECYGNFDDYEKLIHGTGVADRVHRHIRYIDSREVADFFSAADLCILPYSSATQSGIVQLAFNFDLPCIVTDVGGLAEMIEDDVTGRVLHERKPEALAELVRTSFRDDSLQRFSAAIAQKKHAYSWDAFARAVLEFASSLSQSKGAEG